MKKLVISLVALTLMLSLCPVAFASNDGETVSGASILAAAKTVREMNEDDGKSLSNLREQYAGALIHRLPTVDGFSAIKRAMFHIRNSMIMEDERPYDYITRAELAVTLARFYGANLVSVSEDVTFDDVTDDAWYKSAAEFCVKNGLMKANDDKFSPDGRVTLSETLIPILMKMGYGDTGEFVGEDAAMNAILISKYGSTLLDSIGNPNDHEVVRGEVAIIIVNYIAAYSLRR